MCNIEIQVYDNNHSYKYCKICKRHDNKVQKHPYYWVWLPFQNHKHKHDNFDQDFSYKTEYFLFCGNETITNPLSITLTYFTI